MNRLARTIFFLVWTIASLDITSTMSGSHYIVSDLGGALYTGTYSVSFYVLGFMLTFPTGGHLCSMFGRRNVLYYSLIAFTLGNVLCTLHTNYFIFLVIRTFFGCCAGLVSQSSAALIAKHASREIRRKNLGRAGFITTLITSFGVSYGAFIAYEYDWPWIFKLQHPFLFASILALSFYRTSFTRVEFHKFDWIGYISYSCSIFSLVFVTSLGQQLDWFRSPLISNLIGAFGIFTLFFILWQLKIEKPFLNLRLFKKPSFSVGMVFNILINTSFYGITTLLSVWLSTEANYTPVYVAVILLTMFISSFAFYFAFHKFQDTVTSFPSIMLAVAVFALSAYYSSTFNSEVNLGRLMISHTIAGFGFCFSTFPIIIYTLRLLSDDEVDQGRVMMMAFRFLSIGLGVVFYITVWIKRTVFYNVRLGSYLTVNSELTEQTLKQAFFYTHSEEQSLHLLDEALHRQATSLALADCFFLIKWILIGTFVLGLLYAYSQKRKEKQAALEAGKT